MTHFHEDYTGPRWTYGFTYRPVGIGCQPNGFIIGSNQDHPKYRFGTLDWPHSLGDKADSYELTLVKVLLSPETDCVACNGLGEVYDWVPTPFGSGNCAMPSLCACIEEQLAEDSRTDDPEVEVVVMGLGEWQHDNG